jgi:hypothetical protein
LVEDSDERANHRSGWVAAELMMDVEQDSLGNADYLKARRLADVGGPEIGCVGETGEGLAIEKSRELGRQIGMS